ncbi:prepilin peptidase [Betaproteobacteria bacterium]|nr:prepilin peptidase [Betaproteobacteria bacterium]
MICLVQVMYFSLLKIGAIEANHWLGSKKKAELRNNIFVNPIVLITFCILHGLVRFDESYFFWELEFSKIFLLFILTAFWLSCLGSIGTLDLSLRLLPYCLTLPLTLAGIIKGNLVSTDYLDTLFLIFILVFILFSRNNSTSINGRFGLGDIFFILALSFWLDTLALAMTIFLATTTMVIIFMIFKKQFCWTQKTRLPFGPALSFFAIIVEFCWTSFPELRIV